MKKNLPGYYAPLLEQASQKAQRLLAEQTVSFIFIADMHHHPGGGQLHAAEAIRMLSNTLPLDFVVSGGDMSLNGPKSTVLQAQKEIMDELAAVDIPMLPVKGNHDDNSIFGYSEDQGGVEHVLFPEETYELVFQRLEGTVEFDQANRTGMYYYMDLPHKQIRIVVLNVIDIPYVINPGKGLRYPGQWKYAFSNRQLNWAAHQALNLRDKPDCEQWKIIFFSHTAILQDGVSGADHEVVNGEAMWEVIQACRRGKAYAGSETEGDFAYHLDADFSDQGAIPVVACLFGHVHCDQAFKRDGIWMISTLNAACHQEFAESPERIDGTASETAFDLMLLDREMSVIHAIRIGAGEDRVIPSGL